MPDYGFIAQPAPQSGLKSVSDLIGTANAAQNLQAGNVELQKQQIGLAERKAIQDLFSNPAQFHDDKGVVDFNKLINMGMERAPTTFPTMVPQIISAHGSALAAKKAFNEVTAQEQQQAGAFFQALANQPPETVTKSLDEFKAARPELSKWIDFNRTMFVDPYTNDPEKLKRGLYAAGTGWLDSAKQAELATPSGPQVSSNVQTGTLNLRPTAGPVGIVPGTVVNQQLPLGERQTVLNNPVTQSPQTVTKDAFGNVQGVTQTPTGPGVPTFAPGQVQDLPVVTEERAKVNAAAAQVPTQRFNNQQIVKLLDETGTTFAITGPAADRWSKIAGTLGIPWTGDRADNFQKIGHYLAQQAQFNAAAMGAGTDAAREVSHLATGSTAMTPEALKSATRANDALAAGVLAFNQGMEAAIKGNGNNVLAARDFKNAWSQAFDPNVYRYANALEAKDQKEIDSILGKAGPERQARAQQLLQKYQRLQQLVTQGR